MTITSGACPSDHAAYGRLAIVWVSLASEQLEVCNVVHVDIVPYGFTATRHRLVCTRPQPAWVPPANSHGLYQSKGDHPWQLWLAFAAAELDRQLLGQHQPGIPHSMSCMHSHELGSDT